MIKNINWDATAFFERLASANKLAKENGFVFCRVSGLDGFEEAYQGEWDSEEDFAQQLVEDCYCDDFRGMSDLIRNNIDWRGIARDLFSDGYSYEDGFVFYGC